MPPNVATTGVAITNPLVLYRALVSTQKIRPDPAQYRLAVHLQKLYDRLKDYEPTVAYRQRLDRLSRVVDRENGHNGHDPDVRAPKPPKPSKSAWRTFLERKEQRDSLALTRTMTSQEAALHIDSPKGLMLHGEVGTGKSMLIDLFADCLPTRKKRRWHFNTFMLETIAKMEELRRLRSARSPVLVEDDHSLMWLARDLIETSPVLFLDEFQLPDRAASKIMASLMTSFFHLGGVLVATSNRMPEELANASGVEFAAPPTRFESIGRRLGLRRSSTPSLKDSEFGSFLDILKARCEVWEMEGANDYRRAEVVATTSAVTSLEELDDLVAGHTSGSIGGLAESEHDDIPSMSATSPKFYFVKPTSTDSPDAMMAWAQDFEIAQNLARYNDKDTIWSTGSMRVYGRDVFVPRQHNRTCSWTFEELCTTRLGPADYITLASTYDTVILTDVPILSLQQKNEARRFITLLDALYEARCKLLVSAAAGPDDLFFPETRISGQASQDGDDSVKEDAVYAETFSEAYQDVTEPFRPNVSSYDAASRSDYAYSQRDNALAEDALEDDPPNKIRRDVSGTFTDERDYDNSRPGPDFSQSTAFTGEDERFAFKRARSRLWEMCGANWWARQEEGWWKPLSKEVRRWEVSQEDIRQAQSELAKSYMSAEEGTTGTREPDEKDEALFGAGGHSASPFRTHPDPPPKIGWTHVWGTVKWGKKAGPWGQGPEGLGERNKGGNENKDK
ncbi:hypothetical protein EJ05DRAFT_300378 [Pseudovirgaria hyperparasitica]|uniref:AAA+ ATPase domain-containing protein n=1 Tax=Pseudovirgaria hyperparasitica TaxID=470096 RepID=A0A6A6WBT8_9PEZI|nr:uncharacterized protein EJ05DRAFT_300378 [Pseudovirgaria hyperparasitica]KAF2759504.1 hypothetical protein EJ05DRAFT_300378 [Pseudovirgaria hyperparasitica]